jgi:MFS transporter, DHA2 family, methylenomycin A resistance protein
MPGPTLSQDNTRARGHIAGRPGQRGPASLLAVCLGFFIIQLDVTIVNVALPTIQRDIGGTVAGLQWIVDGYTLALASLMLTAGSVADRVGARRIFVIGIAVFATASACCALAPDLGMLIAARVVQGLGASALLPCSLALIVHQYPDRSQRARALGIWGALGSLGVAIGPVIGGLLVEAVTWRAIFWVNVPICAATAVLVLRAVRESPPQPNRHTDAVGLVLGLAALAGATAGFIEAGQQGWLAPAPASLIGGGIVLAVLFVLAERHQRDPMLPLGLFRTRAFTATTGVGALFNLCLYGTLICLSLYLQQARHTSAAATGLLLLPMSAFVGVGSVISGRVTARLGARLPMIAGLTCAACGTVVLSLVDPATPLGLLVGGSVLLGLVSLAMPAMTAVAVGSAGREHAGLASGVLNSARQAGGALGVALLGALLASGGGHAQALRLPMLAATGGYLLAIGLAWLATGHRAGSGA